MPFRLPLSAVSHLRGHRLQLIFRRLPCCLRPIFLIALFLMPAQVPPPEASFHTRSPMFSRLVSPFEFFHHTSSLQQAGAQHRRPACSQLFSHRHRYYAHMLPLHFAYREPSDPCFHTREHERHTRTDRRRHLEKRRTEAKVVPPSPSFLPCRCLPLLL